MGVFSIFKKPRIFFTEEERNRIVQAIRAGERKTSGEIRVFVESKNKWVEPLERAREIFYSLKMEETDDRNAVLIYIAMDHHELAVFADEGIYKREPENFWHSTVANLLREFSHDHKADGLIHCINTLSAALEEMFPYNAQTDKNELPDDIVFGQ